MSDWTETYEYRVYALVDMKPLPQDAGEVGPAGEVFSEWDRRKDWVMALAEDLRDSSGITNVQVERRPRAETVDIETRGEHDE